MNWSIPSYSVGKLTIGMMHVHIVIQCHSYANSKKLSHMLSIKVDTFPILSVLIPVLPSHLFPFPFSPSTLPILFSNILRPLCHKRLIAIKQWFTPSVVTQNYCVINCSSPPHFSPSDFLSLFPFSSLISSLPFLLPLFCRCMFVGYCCLLITQFPTCYELVHKFRAVDRGEELWGKFLRALRMKRFATNLIGMIT